MARRLPPRSANTLHKHIRQEEFYLVLEGTGRLRVGEETLTVPRYGAVLVGPDQLRQVFNDTDAEVLWLIVGAPEELEFLGIRDYFEGDALCLIEWPQRGAGILPKADLDINITPQAGGRSLRLSPHTERGEAWCAALAMGA